MRNCVLNSPLIVLLSFYFEPKVKIFLIFLVAARLTCWVVQFVVLFVGVWGERGRKFILLYYKYLFLVFYIQSRFYQSYLNNLETIFWLLSRLQLKMLQLFSVLNWFQKINVVTLVSIIIWNYRFNRFKLWRSCKKKQ